MTCMWESCTGKKPENTVVNRWAASSAMSMEPPCPMQRTLSPARRISAAVLMTSGWMSAWVSWMAPISTPASLLHSSETLSSGWMVPDSILGSIRDTVAAAMASRNALYPLYPIRRQKREMVASATPQAAASSEMDMLWERWPLAVIKFASFFSEAVSW